MSPQFLLTKFYECTHWTKDEVLKYQAKSPTTLKLETIYGKYIFEFESTRKWSFGQNWEKKDRK